MKLRCILLIVMIGLDVSLNLREAESMFPKVNEAESSLSVLRVTFRTFSGRNIWIVLNGE